MTAAVSAPERVTANGQQRHGGGIDRVPPHNLDAEVSVLGSMLLSADAIDEVTDVVGPADFYRGAHRSIFEAITALHDAGEPADAVTVIDELERRGHLEGVGGAVAVSDVVSFVPSAATAVYYARIVADCALRRRLLDAAGHIAGLVADPPPDATAGEVADQAEALLHQLRHVAQLQQTPGFEAAYVHQNATVGYADNPYEIEARFYGRLADPTGEKDTGPAGTHLGKAAWGLRSHPHQL